LKKIYFSTHKLPKQQSTSFWSQGILGVKIRGFEGGIRVSKWGEPLNYTRVGLLNHQTSKISSTSFWFQFLLWVLKIRGFECRIGVFKRGDPLIPLAWGC
jgi:hypothetical protein